MPLRERLRRAGHPVIGADRDQRRCRDAGDLLWRERLAAAADAGSKRLEVRLRLFRKLPERASVRIGDLVERSGFERKGDRLRQAGALDQVKPEPAEDDGAHAIGMQRCRDAGSPSSPVVTGDGEARQLQCIGEIDNILPDRGLLGHTRRGCVEEARCAVAA